MRKLFLIIVLGLALLPISNVFAQNGEVIRSFTLDAIVDETGYLTIGETITYDFGANERRGIFRDIPTQYLVDGDQGFITDVTVQQVTRDGVAEQFTLINESSFYQRVRIGDPNVTIIGEHTYVIIYNIGPVAIQANDDTEIIRLDAPGTGWEVNAEEVFVRIESSPEISETNCYQGEAGEAQQTCIEHSETIVQSSKTLLAGETLTAEFVYEPGTFTQFAELQTLDFPEDAPIWLPLFIIGIIITLFTTLLLVPALGYIRYLSRRKQEIAYPRYEPPEDLGPAELGLLIDNSSSGAELTAALIQLAVSGHMKIVQTKEKKWYRAAEHQLVKQTGSTNPLRGYQKKLYDAIFSKSNDMLNLSDLFGIFTESVNNPEFSARMSDFGNQILEKSRNNEEIDISEQEKLMREAFGGVDAISTKKLASSLTFQKANQDFHKQLKKNLTKLGFYKKANFFSFTLSSRMSEAGYKKWAEIEGFRKFLTLTEADRMAMLEAPERTPEQFSEFLPYAIALGVEKKWAKQFESLNVDASDWYQGTSSSLNAVYVASSLSTALGAVAKSANRSSGTSGSGGGFSGGGFSGGGGGSW